MSEIAHVLSINQESNRILFTKFAHWVIVLVESGAEKLNKEEVNQWLDFSFFKHVFLVYGYAHRVIISKGIRLRNVVRDRDLRIRRRFQ